MNGSEMHQLEMMVGNREKLVMDENIGLIERNMKHSGNTQYTASHFEFIQIFKLIKIY